MKCSKCGSQMWDNREENVKRRQQGLKARPDFACKDRDNCGNVIWKESEYEFIDDAESAEPSQGNPSSAAQFKKSIGERDYDAENRGKIRSLLLQARVEKEGLTPLTEEEFNVLLELTEVAMTGKSK